MSEWKECKLGDVIEVKYGKDHKLLPDGNIPAYGSGGIMRYVDKAIYEEESILIPRKGSLNNIFYMDKPFWTVDTIFWTKIDKTKTFPKFLFYQLSVIDYTNLNVGSAVPSLTVPVINEIAVLLPPLPEQKSIAAVLSGLDDKIDLLHRQNKTLESMAEALFRQWFVEEADESWEEKPLKELVTVVDNRGKTPPNKEEYTPYPVIEVNALGGRDRLIDYSVIKKYVDEETYKSWFRNKLQKFDILISTVGSIGAMSMYIIELGNVAQNVVGLHAHKTSPFYIYQILKSKTDDLLQLDIGGVQPSIKVPHLLSMLIPIPDQDILTKFDNQLLSFVDKMKINYTQIRTLEKMRDSLLPKLMSGEVRVTI